MFIVGKIGNKIVDSAENAARSKKMEKQSEENTVYSRPSQSLANKLESSSPYYAAQKAAKVNTDAQVRYCMNCGHKLPADASFCNECGTPVTD